MRIKIFYGNAVSGEQRFPRPALEMEMLRLLEHSGGLKMFQLRRIGKSTFIELAQERMRERGYAIVNVDAQGMRSLDQLLLAVFSALPKQDGGLIGRMTSWVTSDGAVPQLLRDAMGAALKGVMPQDPKVSSDIGHYWPTISAQIVKALREDGAKMLLTIDEVTYLLKNLLENQPEHGRFQADMLLASLREWRAAGLKMVLAGSIGLAGLARKHGFSKEHVNDLSNFQIPPLSDDEAQGFVAAAVASEPDSHWTAAHTKALLYEAEVFYPAFLVKGLLAIGVKNPPPAEHFPEVFATRVRPELHDSFLSQLNNRFRLYRELDGAVQRELILPVLKQVMLAGANGCSQASLTPPAKFDRIDIQETLSLLQEDGFILYHEARDTGPICRPASSLVELWWKRTGL
jgi:hypothetical protein